MIVGAAVLAPHSGRFAPQTRPLSYAICTKSDGGNINKTYGKNQETTLATQLDDFHVIADTAASFLMGNAMAMVDESSWNDDLKTLNTHVRQIAIYVARNQRAELGQKI